MNEDRKVIAAIEAACGAGMFLAGVVIATLAGLMPWGLPLVALGAAGAVHAVLLRLGVIPVPGDWNANENDEGREDDRPRG